MGRKLLIKSVQAATLALRLKAKKLEPAYLRARAEKLHRQQSEELEAAIEKALVPMFKDQIDSTIKDLKGLGQSEAKPFPTSRIFNPAEWNVDLVNRALPPIAKSMAKAMLKQ